MTIVISISPRDLHKKSMVAMDDDDALQWPSSSNASDVGDLVILSLLIGLDMILAYHRRCAISQNLIIRMHRTKTS